LKSKHQARRGRLSVRCEAAVAEPEEATGEKFEYQAEVGFHFSIHLSVYLPFCPSGSLFLNC
jgi:hypothetical protein